MRSNAWMYPLSILVFVVLAVTANPEPSNRYHEKTEKSPTLTISGISAGMWVDDALLMISKRYGIKAQWGSPRYVFLLGGSTVYFEVGEGRVHWVAGERLEFDGKPIALGKEGSPIPDRLGASIPVTRSDMPLCDQADSGFWFPEHQLLICDMGSQERVVSLGDRMGWSIPKSHDKSWKEIRQEIHDEEKVK